MLKSIKGKVNNIEKFVWTYELSCGTVCVAMRWNQMKVLEEFWYGNINPMERPFQSQRKFDKAFRMLTKNEEKLLESLNEQEKELFDKFKACYDEMIQVTECQTFIKGFKLGARFVMACIESDSDIYDDYA